MSQGEQEKLISIKTLKELNELLDYIEDKEYVALDTETTGVKRDSSVIGISLCAEPDLAYYVVLSYWNVQQQKLIDLETAGSELLKILLNKLITKQLIMHNSVFDCAVIEQNFNVSLMPSVHTDTMILAHIVDENRHVGLKELGVSIFGDNAKKEQIDMKQSVTANGGKLTKAEYELYKADMDLIALYGAKDALLTFKLFYELVPKLFEEGLDSFFYDTECMPLLKGPTYELNRTGLKIDPDKLDKLKGELEVEMHTDKAFIYSEIESLVKDMPFKGEFNINSSKHLAWLLYIRLGNEFHTLTEEGRNVCKALEMRVPYAPSHKKEFLRLLKENTGKVYEESKWNYKTKKMSRPKKLGVPWNYIMCGKVALAKIASRYKWVESLLRYKKNDKILTTYVIGIKDRQTYNVIYPSFLQHGTTSGRYSSRNPNFQNLPKDDKRVKSCIVSRPGKVFVGADYSQLEPRVFTSVSQDPALLDCFEKGQDFYSVVGAPIFDKGTTSLFKEASDSFATKHPELRDVSKQFALATSYGTSAFKQSQMLNKSTEECQGIIDKYFAAFPKVELMMLESHEIVKKEGKVFSLYGRPRRIPKALDITKIFKQTPHGELPYEYRTLLNLGMNHRVQSSAASIMNRAAIRIYNIIKELALEDKVWNEVKIILQIHDEIVLEGPEQIKEEMAQILKECMENTTVLPGVKLIAKPKCAKSLAELK